MLPKLWPEEFTYSRESIPREIPRVFLLNFLSTGRPEDFIKRSLVIEEKCVCSHLEIKEITPSFMLDGQMPHPLCHKKTSRGRANYGVFATEKIDAGTEIGEYVGEIYLVSDKKSLQAFVTRIPPNDYTWFIKINNLFVIIDAQKIANETALINDYRGIGIKPNVQMQIIVHKGIFYFVYVAVNDIQKGEELLVDYRKIKEQELENVG